MSPFNIDTTHCYCALPLSRLDTVGSRVQHQRAEVHCALCGFTKGPLTVAGRCWTALATSKDCKIEREGTNAWANGLHDSTPTGKRSLQFLSRKAMIKLVPTAQVSMMVSAELRYDREIVLQ